MTDWIMLRTKPSCTLSLTNSLAAAGFDVWTPMEVQQRRVPRSKAKRERRVPIMPTWIFARAHHLDDLRRLAERAIKDHAEFSIFRWHSRVPAIDDVALEALRSAELRAVPKQKVKAFRKGEIVRVPEGAFAGMSGVVERGDGRCTLVCFGGRLEVEISTFLLRPSTAQAA